MTDTPEAILAKPDLHISPDEIAAVFGRSPAWFNTSRIRRRLEARGFPRPVSRGVWLRDAVRQFVQSAGGMRRPTQAGQGERR